MSTHKIESLRSRAESRLRRYSLDQRRVAALLFVLLLVLIMLFARVASAAAAPVSLDGVVVLTVHAPLGPFTAEQRAQAISERLLRLAETQAKQQLQLNVGDTSTDILAGDTVLLSLTDADAQALQRTRDELATDYVATLSRALTAAQQVRSSEQRMRASVHTLLATVGLIIFGLLLRAIGAGLRHRIHSGQAAGKLALRMQKAELISSDRMAITLRRALGGLCATLLMLGLYFYASLVFGFFPATRGHAAALTAALITPLQQLWQSFSSYLPNLGVIVVVMALAYLLTRWVRFVFSELGKGTLHFKGFHPEWADTTFKISRFIIIVFVLVVVFPYLPGAKSPAFEGIAIFLGAMLSFGSGSAAANVIAGVVLTYTRAFRLGDRIKVKDTEGDVIGKTLIATHVRTIKNVVITIPNSVVLSSHVVNYSTEAPGSGLILHTTVTIGYDVPWRKVHELLIGAAHDTAHIIDEPAAYVLQKSLDDFYVSYQVNAYTREAALQAGIYSELHQNIQDRFHNAGVEMLSPHYTALRDGNTMIVPPQNLPQNYVAPAIRVRAVG